MTIPMGSTWSLTTSWSTLTVDRHYWYHLNIRSQHGLPYYLITNMIDMQRKMWDQLFIPHVSGTSLKSLNRFIIYLPVNKTSSFISQCFFPKLLNSTEVWRQLTFTSNRAINTGISNGTGQNPKPGIRIIVCYWHKVMMLILEGRATVSFQ